MKPAIALVSLLSFIGTIFCLADSERDTPSLEIRAPEDLKYIRQLRDGSIEEKMKAADKLRELRSVRAVPYLLQEMRLFNYRLRNAVYEPGERGDPQVVCGSRLQAYVFINGKKEPYRDYHEPIYSALSALSVPYFGSDETWYDAIEEWCRKRGLHLER